MVMSSFDVKEKIAKRLKDLPTLPHVAQRVIEIAYDPKSSAANMSEVISQDQSLTAKVLRVVNSAYYGFPRKIELVKQAVVILGFKAVSDLVISVSVFDAFKRKTNLNFDMLGFWRHSIAVAVTSKILAKYSGFMPVEDVFVPGLLHDIGKVVMVSFLPEEYGKVMDTVSSTGRWIRDVEEEILGIDHAAVGRFVADKWNFPPKIVSTIFYHHKPLVAKDYKDIVGIVHAADVLVRVRKIGWGGDETIPTLNREVWAMLKLSPDILNDIYESMQEHVKKAEEFFKLAQGG